MFDPFSRHGLIALPGKLLNEIPFGDEAFNDIATGHVFGQWLEERQLQRRKDRICNIQHPLFGCAGLCR
ncbi:MAG: hypothetical protein ACPGRD_10095 [Planktomarina sp.]